MKNVVRGRPSGTGHSLVIINTRMAEPVVISVSPSPLSDRAPPGAGRPARRRDRRSAAGSRRGTTRSEEHTSELQSRLHLVCRLLLEKKKKDNTRSAIQTVCR